MRVWDEPLLHQHDLNQPQKSKLVWARLLNRSFAYDLWMEFNLKSRSSANKLRNQTSTGLRSSSSSSCWWWSHLNRQLLLLTIVLSRSRSKVDQYYYYNHKVVHYDNLRIELFSFSMVNSDQSYHNAKNGLNSWANHNLQTMVLGTIWSNWANRCRLVTVGLTNKGYTCVFRLNHYKGWVWSRWANIAVNIMNVYIMRAG